MGKQDQKKWGKTDKRRDRKPYAVNIGENLNTGIKVMLQGSYEVIRGHAYLLEGHRGQGRAGG